jgi:hypothetical protein
MSKYIILAQNDELYEKTKTFYFEKNDKSLLKYTSAININNLNLF